MRQITVYQDLINQAYRPRHHFLTASVTAVGSVIPVSASGLYFEKAFFYGVKVVPADGGAMTPNQASVFIGEKEDGKIYCLDEVTNDPSAPVLVQAPAGGKLNFADFFVRIGTPGDKLFVKYQ